MLFWTMELSRAPQRYPLDDGMLLSQPRELVETHVRTAQRPGCLNYACAVCRPRRGPRSERGAGGGARYRLTLPPSELHRRGRPGAPLDLQAIVADLHQATG
jgi:hypothetical protein